MIDFLRSFTGNKTDDILHRSNKYTDTIALDNNTDLDSIKDAGTYAAWNGTKAATISHRPPGVVGGFTIIVFSPNGLSYTEYNNPCQIYMGTDRDAIFIRYYDTSNNVWETNWYRIPFIRADRAQKGTTSERPVFAQNSTGRERFYIGYYFFDTDLGKPIWWNGNGWIDATGTNV